MALSTGSQAAWSDIQTLFTNLNTARTKFSYATITPTPAGGAGTSITTTNTIAQLKTNIDAMKSNTFLSSTLSSFSLTVPASGTLIQPTLLNQISGTINEIQAKDAFKVGNSFSSNSFGFSSDSSFNASFSSDSNNRQFGFTYYTGQSTCAY